MSPILLALTVGCYFLTLYGISYFIDKRTSSNLNNFFIANKQTSWFWITFGMIGTSLSGVTFISVPGAVGSMGLTYIMVALGYAIGYWIIAKVLLPIYYKRNLISIYTFLDHRFGKPANHAGAIIFFISRSLGSSVRLYLAISVLQTLVFNHWGIPFEVTGALTLGFIVIYTQKSGIKTIIYTDTFQTFFMILSMLIALLYLYRNISFEFPFGALLNSKYGLILDFDLSSPTFILKQLAGGALIAVVMTGLDQDMMQKNLACRNLKEAQLNMYTFSGILLVVNIVFVLVGGLLYIHASDSGFHIPKNTDMFFPNWAVNQTPTWLGILVILGLTAAAFSSIDGTIAALTTSICIDILAIQNKNNDKAIKIKNFVFYSITFFLFLLLITFNEIYNIELLKHLNVISIILNMASYTYGPLLGMFLFGIISNRTVRKQFFLPIIVLSPLLAWGTNELLKTLFDYQLGLLLLALNGLYTYLLLYFFSSASSDTNK